jgi:hypothetical protein
MQDPGFNLWHQKKNKKEKYIINKV